jgi:lysozyme family protein
VHLTKPLRDEYEHLFDVCHIRPERARKVERQIDRIAANHSRYTAVAEEVGIPWYVVAVIHNMEASLAFDRHLHNGDPLGARTVHVPPGRPATGTPPYTWEESAVDALRFDRLDRWRDWSIAGTLFKLEGFNGFGYRNKHPDVLTPYLWSFSTHYTRGKFVADGRFSDTAVSDQCGAAVLLRRLAERSLVEFGEHEPITPPERGEEIEAKPSITYWTKGGEIPGARALQSFLNTMPGIFVKVDGKPGERTSNALKKVLGHYLAGDPRDA